MIIVKLFGGLGNQMFQYALGRRLAWQSGEELKLDISYFDSYHHCQYALNHFRIQEAFASPEEVRELEKRSFFSKILRRKSYLREKHFHFDVDAIKLRKHVLLAGYWQSEQYFRPISEILQDEFQLKQRWSDENQEMAETIQRTPSISLHVRRGDYVSNPDINKVHGTCSLNYYETCINIFADLVEQPHYFLFSDEPDWARENIRCPFPVTIVSHNGLEMAVNDMLLMATCQHQIVANSSFSWWGAWLNQNPNKIVLAPKPWFLNPELNTKDLLVDGWRTVQA